VDTKKALGGHKKSPPCLRRVWVDTISLQIMIWNDGLIVNGSLDSYPASGDKGLIYEVIRVKDSTPVFLREHLERFWKAGKETGLPLIYSEEDLIKGFFDIIRENNITEGNLRLQAELGNGRALIGEIPHHYPTIADYQNGVAVDLVMLERDNPNVKSWNKKVRKFSDDYIRKNNVFEVILTSDKGFLREGSRSNIFGFQKGILKTPPEEHVLPGITRQKIIEISENHNIPFVEEPIHKEEINSFQSFFLTGTSPGVLPIKSIGNNHFNCKSSTCNNIRKSYEEEVQNSILELKKI